MSFDWKFLQSEYKLNGLRILPNSRICTVKLAKKLLPQLPKRNLDTLANYFKLKFESRHRAMGDVKVTTDVLHHLINLAHTELNIVTTQDLLLIGESGKAGQRKKIKQKRKKPLF
jgi:DNA polymerase-3 subunit epsilon